MIVNNSSFAITTYRWQLDNGVPDGQRRLRRHLLRPTRQRERASPRSATSSPRTASSTTACPRLMKAMGAKKVGSGGVRHLGVVDRGGRRTCMKLAVPAVGLEEGLPQHDCRLRHHRRRPARARHQERRHRCRLPPDGRQQQPRGGAGSRVQNGVKMKSTVLATGYGQALLDQPVAKTLGPEVVLATPVRAGRVEDQGHQAVPGRLEEVRRLHRDPRLRRVHGLHHLRPGDPRPEERRATRRHARRLRRTCAS